MTYAEKLKDPRWQEKRLEVMERAGYVCRECGSNQRTLNVHHGFYRKGAEPWEYDAEELMCLCSHCHKDWHGVHSRLLHALSQMDADQLEVVLGYALAIGRAQVGLDQPVEHINHSNARGVADLYQLEAWQVYEQIERGIPITARLLCELQGRGSRVCVETE